MPVYRKRRRKTYRKKSKKSKSSVDRIQNKRINTIEKLMLRNGGQMDFSINRYPLVRPNVTTSPTCDVYSLSLNNNIMQGPFECNRRDKSVTLKNLSMQLLVEYDLSPSLITDPVLQPQSCKVNILIVRYKEAITAGTAPPTFNPDTFVPYDQALQDITLSCQDQNGNQTPYILRDNTGAFGQDRFNYLMFNTNPEVKYEVLYNKCHFLNSALTTLSTAAYQPPGFPTRHGATKEKIININLKGKVRGKVVEYENIQSTEKLAANTPGNLLNTLGVPKVEPQVINKGEIVMYAWADVPAGTGVIQPQLSGHMRLKWL